MSDGFLEGLAAHGFWSGATAILRKISGRQIKITSPRSGEVLQSPQPLGQGFSFPVNGTLKHLPKDHQIWLLVEDPVSGDVRPQGFFSAIFDHEHGTWNGRVNPAIGGQGERQVKIVAVVAPPTSNDFFNYFQRVGGLTNYTPLTRIPPECLKNSAYVQARIPSTTLQSP